MGNSQFRKLSDRVERLESLIGGGDNKDQHRKAREIDNAVTHIAQQQKGAMSILQNSATASPEELRSAIPFLKTRGLQEQARYEADAKEQYMAFEASLGAPLITDSTLIDNMRNADSAWYQQWQSSQLIPAQQQAPAVLPAPASRKQSPKRSANAMQAAQKLWNQSYEQTQAKMAPHRGPLSPNSRDEAGLMLPNPLNGIVI